MIIGKKEWGCEPMSHSLPTHTFMTSETAVVGCQVGKWLGDPLVHPRAHGSTVVNVDTNDP